MAELRERLSLDLPNPLMAEPKFGADLLERSGTAVIEAEAKSEDSLFAPGKGLEDGVDLFLEERLTGGIEGSQGALVLNEVAKHRVALLARRLLERNRPPLDIAAATSSIVGSRPSSRARARETPLARKSSSPVCTGSLIVRDFSAIARVTAWRIHQ